MVLPHSLEPHLSTTEWRVLGYLNQQWPSAATVTPDLVPFAGSSDRTAFVDVMQSLSDNGLILYEAFAMGSGPSVRFIETMITARGRAALRTAEVTA